MGNCSSDSSVLNTNAAVGERSPGQDNCEQLIKLLMIGDSGMQTRTRYLSTVIICVIRSWKDRDIVKI